MSLSHHGLSLENLSPEHKQRFNHILEVFSEGLFHLDNQGILTFFTPDFYTQFGFKNTQITYEEWVAVVHPLDRHIIDKVFTDFITHLLPGEQKNFQYRLRKFNGQYTWIESNVVSKTENGETFMVGRHCDISDQKLVESYLRQTAYYDSASGLANRAKLLIDIENAKKDDIDYTLLYIAIDDLRSYFNQYGSDVSQHLLQHILGAIQTIPNGVVECYQIRSDDIVVLIRDHNDSAELQRLCQTVHQEYARAMNEHGHLYGDKMNIGVYPKISNDINAEQIINIASRTCQYAREKQASPIEIYAGKTQRQVDRFFFIERGLKEALNSKSLKVKFQPIIHAESGEVSSFEALVRWRSKEFGEIYPDEFIPIAEKKGLISELGYQVFSKACQFIVRYNKQHGTSVKVNVNVSALQLLELTFPENIQSIAKQIGIVPSSIVLELTETVVLDGNRNAINQLIKLSDIGFQLALDDFGTGFSSMNSFFDLPLNQIKIDRSMAVKSMENNAMHDYLAFIINLSRANGIHIVVEGIEDQAMYKKFLSLGAVYLQGYWLSKPLSIATASRYSLYTQS
ncbi:EAL domain-containing protein [Vibrio zhugei]|uniref:EAL domain-containing protein n=1 Tax=Vibrio zhugei TaxID=2479546 RepID=A0ABV7C559_9VIBR|nr:GGDEF domain-containing phosphodiesterase [Vibrio zhugei]